MPDPGHREQLGLWPVPGLRAGIHITCVLQKHILKTDGVRGTKQKTRLKTRWHLLVPGNSKCNNIWGAVVDI